MSVDLPVPTVAPGGTGRRPSLPPRHLADVAPSERADLAAEVGERPFRVRQVERHWFAALTDPDDAETAMTDLPAPERRRLADALLPRLLRTVRHVEADEGTTRKTLHRLHDGSLVESVLMRYPGRITSCVSSQAGCGMGCPFCATGQAGLTRNLSTAEIVDQVVTGARAVARGELPGGPGRLSNVVFMGMGEPLANYARTVAAVRRLTDPAPGGLGLSQRSVTVSTVGVAPAMRRLAEEGLQVTLALSLHAPDDELRSEMLPVNDRWPVAEVLDAAWLYADRTGRRVSFEYVMLGGENDDLGRADLLGRLLRGRLAHVNLIPLNPTPGGTSRPSSRHATEVFLRRLHDHGVTATVRDTRGRDADAACGQLAAVG